MGRMQTSQPAAVPRSCRPHQPPTVEPGNTFNAGRSAHSVGRAGFMSMACTNMRSGQRCWRVGDDDRRKPSPDRRSVEFGAWWSRGQGRAGANAACRACSAVIFGRSIGARTLSRSLPSPRCAKPRRERKRGRGILFPDLRHSSAQPDVAHAMSQSKPKMPSTTSGVSNGHEPSAVPA